MYGPPASCDAKSVPKVDAHRASTETCNNAMRRGNRRHEAHDLDAGAPAPPACVGDEHERDECPHRVVVPRQRPGDQADEHEDAEVERLDLVGPADPPEAQRGADRERDPEQVPPADRPVGDDVGEAAEQARQPGGQRLVVHVAGSLRCARGHVAEPDQEIARSPDRGGGNVQRHDRAAAAQPTARHLRLSSR